MFAGGFATHAQEGSCTKPSFAPVATYPSGGNFLIATATADFNKDGVLDLAVANNYSPNLGVLIGKGNGSFAQVVVYSTGSKESCLGITNGDFNRDGNMDLAVAIGGGQGVGILLGKGDGSFTKISTYPSNNIYYSIATGDFNRDGNLDLALAGGSIGVLLGKGDGSFAQEVTYPGATIYAYCIVVGDLNTDGVDDLAVANYSGEGAGVLLGTGNGSFDPVVTYPSGGDNATSITLGDFNEDGNRDLAVANWGSGTIGVLLGKGDGSFALAAAYASHAGFTFAVASADFNGDGTDDLATADYDGKDAGFAGMLLGAGNGSFQQQITFSSAGRRPYSIATGDFNNDGKVDVAVSNSNNGYEGTVGVLLNTCGAVLNTYYRDKDGDGFGDPNHSTLAASQPAGYVDNNRDCDDTRVTYKDQDKDGFGSSTKVPCGGVANNYDRDDRDGKPRIYICHKGATLIINANALKGHLRHGDYGGQCSPTAITQNHVNKAVVEPVAEQVTFSAAPNPFTYAIHIQYSLPVDARISLKIYDILGREVATVFNGQRSAGTYRQEYSINKLAAGVYYCRLIATTSGKEVVRTLKLVKTGSD